MALAGFAADHLAGPGDLEALCNGFLCFLHGKRAEKKSLRDSFVKSFVCEFSTTYNFLGRISLTSLPLFLCALHHLNRDTK